MRLLIGIFIILIFAGCKPADQNVQSAAAPQLTGSCTVGKWPNVAGANGTPLNLKISTDFANDFNGLLVNGLNPLEQMAKVWNNAISGTTFLKVPFDTASTTGYSSVSGFHDNEMGIYKSYTWFPNVSSSALAITQFYGYVRTDPTLGNYIELNHADIIVNYNNYGAYFSSNLPTNLGYYDLPTVVLHEMGHFLGLCHEYNHVSIMQPYYNSTQRSLQTYDVTKINDLYTNNTITPLIANNKMKALNMPEGSPVRGIVELNANGKCKHYINGKLVFEH